jgi:AcrR family transcriptional regulator
MARARPTTAGVTGATKPDAPRTRLVREAVTYVRERGFADVSLRELAAALGTSHRMLIYHFGSKEALFVEVIRSFEAEQRDVIAALVAAADVPGPMLLRRIWRQVSAPEHVAQVRLFFQVCGQALSADAASGPAGAVLDRIIGDWVEPMAEIERRHTGSSPAVARADVRVGIAVMRGLLLDLVATDDRRGVNRAFDRFVEAWSAGRG